MKYKMRCLHNCRGARFNYYANEYYTCSEADNNLYGIYDDMNTFAGYMDIEFIKRHFNISYMYILEEVDLLFNKHMDYEVC